MKITINTSKPDKQQNTTRSSKKKTKSSHETVIHRIFGGHSEQIVMVHSRTNQRASLASFLSHKDRRHGVIRKTNEMNIITSI